MSKTRTLLLGLLFLCTVSCARKQTVDFAKELSGKIPVGASQADAEKERSPPDRVRSTRTLQRRNLIAAP